MSSLSTKTMPTKRPATPIAPKREITPAASPRASNCSPSRTPPRSARRSEERRVGKECRSTRWTGDWSSDVCSSDLPSGRVRSTEYALLHLLMDGVYYVVVIDEDDADEATRNANCAKAGDYACRVTTREQLFAFAHATAVRKKIGRASCRERVQIYEMDG